jgi:hypothetical protein
MRILLAFILPLLLAGNGMAAAAASDKIATSIRKALPKGWTVTSSEHRVLISKDKDVTFYNAVSMSSHEPKEVEDRLRYGRKGPFKIQLIIGPLLSQKNYADIKSTLPQGTYGMKLTIPDQPLYSLNADALPDVHGPDYSVYISTSRHPYALVWPEESNQEWQEVLASVKKLFQEYK